MATVISLKIHFSVSYLYSLSVDAVIRIFEIMQINLCLIFFQYVQVLKAWDLKTETILQTIYLGINIKIELVLKKQVKLIAIKIRISVQYENYKLRRLWTQSNATLQ